MGMIIDRPVTEKFCCSWDLRWSICDKLYRSIIAYSWDIVGLLVYICVKGLDEGIMVDTPFVVAVAEIKLDLWIVGWLC